MALPLPQVVSDVGPGGPLVSALGGMNALTKSNAEARYAPWTEYANALSKIAYGNMLPYQIQAQVLSNPLLAAAYQENPKAYGQLITNMTNSAQKGMSATNALPSPGQMPGPPQGGNPLSQIGNFANDGINWLRNKIGMGNVPQGTMQNNGMMMPQNGMPASQGAGPMVNPNDPSASGSEGTKSPGEVSTFVNNAVDKMNNNPILPAANGTAQGIIGQQTAKYNESPHKPGTLTYDPNTGLTISVPASGTVEAMQNSMNATKRVAPQLTRLADAALPFMSLKGKWDLNKEKAYNFIFNPKGDKAGKLPTQYEEMQSLIQSAPEALVKAYGLRPTNETIDRMEKVIHPGFGETGQQYKQRILRGLEHLRDEQIEISKDQLAKGFNLTPEQPKYNMDISTNPEEIANAKNNATSSKKDNLINVINKEGVRGTIPERQWPLAQKQGYKRQ